MKKVLAVLCLLSLPASLRAQALPRPTAEGQKALQELIGACLKDGALKFVTEGGPGGKRTTVIDEARLKEAARRHREKLTPTLRGALVACYQDPAAVALLLRLGQEAGDDEAVAFGRLLSALPLREQRKYAEARQGLQQAAALFGRVKRNDWQALALDSLAVVCRDEGNLPPALAFAEQALTLRRQLHGGPHRDVAQSLSNLGEFCREQGDLARARRLHEEALAMRKQVLDGHHPHIAVSLNNLAVVCLGQGDLPRARRLHEESLRLRRQHYGSAHQAVAPSLINLAQVCRAEGDLPRARQLGEEALALLRRLDGDHRDLIATCLSDLAIVYQAQGDVTRALQLQEESLELSRHLHGKRHPEVAASLNNLAAVCLAQGARARARSLIEEAVGVLTALYGERHPDRANALNTLVEVCRDQGDLPGAVRHGREAVLACRLPGARAHNPEGLRPEDLTCEGQTVMILQRLGAILRRAGPDSGPAAREAAAAYALAAGVLDRLRSDVLEGEEGKLHQGDVHAALVPARVGLAADLFRREGDPEDLRAAFTAAEQGRARVFLESLARARSGRLGGVPDALLQEERDLLAHVRGIEGVIRKENDKTLDQRDAAQVAKLYEELAQKRGEVDRLAIRLRRDYPGYADLQYPKPCTLEQARDCLGANEVAVLFALDPKESFAVVVQKAPAPGDKGQGVAVVRLPGADVLGPKVRALTDPEVLKSDSRCRRLGAELHDLLLRPLAEHVAGKDLVLVPDGLLWELPFELLVEGRPGESDGKYLIEGRRVRYAPSLTVLHLTDLWEKTRQSPTEPLWALGDPVFDAADRRAKGDVHREARALLGRYTLRDGGDGAAWRRLPATGEEVRAIARLHGAGPDDVVTGALASERVLKSASEAGVLARKRYVHLATHGWLGSGRGLPPSLVLSLVGSGGEEQLGGVNDGFLTMQEVTHLKLNADLVVLSACQTGKGDLRPGEGVVGLSRAFLYAGSRGVVCTLWSVDDERTADLMRAMYAGLKGGKPAAEALALARRRLIAQEQAPFYWAPFILIGK